MADGGLAVIDGTALRDPDFILPIPAGAVTGAQILDLAQSEAAARLFGLSLPENLKSGAVARISGGDGDGFLSMKFDGLESQKEKVREYLLAVADELQDDPLVISILDGSALRLFLDDEDDFAMLAENVFTDLDVDDRGKLTKNEIKNALAHMGVGNGVPPFPESSDLLNNILNKHGAQGEEQLGQAQFAQLLQPVLQDLADALSEKHVTVVQNIKVINGSKLRKILADQNLFGSVIEGMYQDWGATKTGEGNKEKFRVILEAKGTELGLPSAKSNEAVVLLYDQILPEVGEKVSDVSNRDAFQEVVKEIFTKFQARLKADPVFIDLES